MKHFYLIVCAFLLSAAFTVVAADKPQCARKIEIGKNVGAVLEPNKVQIVLANKFKSTRFAAEELAELLGEALGSPIPIVETPQAGCTPIYLGLGAENSGLDAAKLSRDAFFIVVKDGAIRIAGEDDPKIDTRKEIQKGGAWGNWHERGTVFGVYEFLERFADCRFYLPGPMGTIIPKTDKITVPEAAIIDRPDWAGRRLNDVYSNTYYWGENVRKVKHPGKNLQQVRLRLSTQMPVCMVPRNSICANASAKPIPSILRCVQTAPASSASQVPTAICSVFPVRSAKCSIRTMQLCSGAMFPNVQAWKKVPCTAARGGVNGSIAAMST